MFVRVLGLLGVCLCVALPAQAATLYVDSVAQSLSRGDARVFKVRIDTDQSTNECINAVSGVLQFSGSIEPIDTSTGDSIISMWVEPPVISQDKTSVSFTGGIPNGYCGRVDGDPQLTNTLFEVIARADVSPSVTGGTEVATVTFDDDQTSVLLNDGFGSPAAMYTVPAQVTVNPTASTLVSDPWTQRIAADVRAPQEFSLQLTRDQNTFGGRYYISFNTTDKQTGIDHYEVMEEPLSQSNSYMWGRSDAPWVEARSPYALSDQSLNSTIRVRAIDKAGNEYVATLIPDESLRTLSSGALLSYVLYATLALGLVIVGALALRQLARHRAAARVAAYDTLSEKDVAADVHIDHDNNHTV